MGARLDVRSQSADRGALRSALRDAFFQRNYGLGSTSDGAYPSLHVAHPLLVTWVTFQVPKLKAFRPPALGFYLIMCFSAVYLQHHYVVDIRLGMSLPLAGAFFTARLIETSKNWRLSF